MVNDIPKPAVPATVDPRLQAMYMKASELVGMEEQMNELVKMLSLGNDIDLSSDKSMKIVSVVGLGGLGKTTLAKVVYDKFKLGFDCGAFVPVGMHPNMKKVLRDILIGLDKRMYMNSYTTSLDEKQLIDELHEILQIKRYEYDHPLRLYHIWLSIIIIC
jgi:ABC-type glutathione transport system ATPase component